MPETIDELQTTLDKADRHTEFLMQRIAELESQLKAAQFAAKHNWDGWQQEIARNSDKTNL